MFNMYMSYSSGYMVVESNNTGQQTLSDYLDSLGHHTDIKIMEIRKTLQGDIDFSIIKTKGFTNVKTITIDSGEITSISHLPDNLEKFVCKNHNLTAFEFIPKNIVELDLENNMITAINVSSLDKLRVLNINGNRINELELPDQIEEVYCNNNAIKAIELRNTKRLRVLHCENNSMIIIKNIPSTLVDLKSDNNPYIEMNYENNMSKVSDADIEKKINYNEALHEYFKLQNKYETNLLDEKRIIYKSVKSKRAAKLKLASVVPKCVRCRKPGGTIFKRTSSTYVALCGAKTPNCINIELYSGEYFSLDEMLETDYSAMESSKTEIIKQKMDSIFKYASDDKIVSKFNEILEDYNLVASIYNMTLAKYAHLWKDETKEENIKLKRAKIFELIDAIRRLVLEYQKNGNRQLLKNAIEIQTKELDPEIHNLRMLNHEIMEMKFISKMNIQNLPDEGGNKEDADGKDKEANKAVNSIKINHLMQKYAGLLKTEYSMADAPHVVKMR